MAVNKNRKDGRFCKRIYLGQKDGKQRYKAVYGHSQKEVDAKALQIKMKLQKGIDIMSEKDTFEKWAQNWLKIKEAEVSESWYRNCDSYVRQLKPLYNRTMVAIRTADIQNFLLDLARRDPHTGKPASRRTLQGYRNTIRQILQLAIDNRVMDYNPANPVKLPSNPSTKQKRRALTKEEQKWILETPHRAQRAAMIMMFSGLRRGELIPLTWNDIDLNEHTIQVNKSVEMRNNKPVVKPTAKTNAGNRIINIPNVLVQYLIEERRNQDALNLLVCPDSRGQMFTAQGWRSLWESYLLDLNIKYGHSLRKNGKAVTSKYIREPIVLTIPNITAHWLRHTFATMLYLSGVDILTAKDQLGHSDIKTTLEIYTHLDRIYKKKNISKLDAYLNNREPA